jgi:hypothetical protein
MPQKRWSFTPARRATRTSPAAPGSGGQSRSGSNRGDESVNVHCRGNRFYDLSKISAMRLAFAMAQELRGHHVTAVALNPDVDGR